MPALFSCEFWIFQVFLAAPSLDDEQICTSHCWSQSLLCLTDETLPTAYQLDVTKPSVQPQLDEEHVHMLTRALLSTGADADADVLCVLSAWRFGESDDSVMLLEPHLREVRSSVCLDRPMRPPLKRRCRGSCGKQDLSRHCRGPHLGFDACRWYRQSVMR